MTENGPKEWIRGIQIGRGSFSTVNLAIPTRRDDATIPELLVVKSSDASTSDSLLNERDILRLLGGRCPQIIRCFGGDTTAENGCRLYNLFFEYASGGSLYDHIRRKPWKRLPEYEVRRHANSILRGLCFIHDAGLVHCDIKLQNILVFGDGDVKISDFGLARERVEKRGGFELRGTPLYMSPEVVAGGDGGSAADVWAMGCAVVEMVSGVPAWRCEPGCGVPELLCRIGAGDESPEIPEGLGEDGKDFLRKCFVKDPTERWTARMLLDHPFVAGFGEVSESVSVDTKGCDWTVSPKGPFDFPEYTPVTQESGAFYSEEEFEWEEVAGNPPEWSDSESDGWITVR